MTLNDLERLFHVKILFGQHFLNQSVWMSKRNTTSAIPRCSVHCTISVSQHRYRHAQLTRCFSAIAVNLSVSECGSCRTSASYNVLLCECFLHTQQAFHNAALLLALSLLRLNPGPCDLFTHTVHFYSASATCYAKRCIRYDRFRPSVRRSPVSCQNDLSYDHGLRSSGQDIPMTLVSSCLTLPRNYSYSTLSYIKMLTNEMCMRWYSYLISVPVLMV